MRSLLCQLGACLTPFPELAEDQAIRGDPELSLSPPAVEPMFWEVMRLRKEMSLAKLGFFLQEA